VKARLSIGLLAACAGLFAVFGGAAGPVFASHCEITPVVREISINQGLPSYGTATNAALVRGHDTLVRVYLSLPSRLPNCVARNAVVSAYLTGASLNISASNSGGSAALANNLQPTPVPASPFPPISTYATAPAINSPGDPMFVVPGELLKAASLTGRFTATFSGSISFQSKFSETATATGGHTPVSFSKSVTFEKTTNGMRLLVVPMGVPDAADATNLNWFGGPAESAIAGGMQTLARIFPVPKGTASGVGALGDAAGGVRYSVNRGDLVDVRNLLRDASGNATTDLVNGKFCGTSAEAEFSVVESAAAQFLRVWNQANPTRVADKAVAAVDELRSKSGSPCLEGAARMGGNVAWVRAMHASGSPLRTGALLALETMHLLGGVPAARDDNFNITHSPRVAADSGTGDLNRGYNTSTGAYLSDDRSAMKLSSATAWLDANTLFEPVDWQYGLCALGGTATTECQATVGTTPVGAVSAAFVMSGATGDTKDSTKVIESYAVASPTTAPDPVSPYRLRFLDANGNPVAGSEPAGLGVPVADTHSHHSADADHHGNETTKVFSFALSYPAELQTATDKVVLCKQTTSGCTELYSVQRSAPPTIETATTEPATGSGGGTSDCTSACNTGKLVLAKTDTDVDLEIVTMRADGSGLTWLTNNAFTDRAPAWSPDNSRIAFESSRDGNREIYVMNADGTNVVRVTNDPAADTDPTWTADSRLLWVSQRDNATGDLFVSPASGLTGTPAKLPDTTGAQHPTTQPNGFNAAFASLRDGAWKIYRISLSCGEICSATEVTPGINPSYSPNGTKIAFYRAYDVFGETPANSNLWVVNADGTNATRLTTTHDAEFDPQWSPLGDKLVYYRTPTITEGPAIGAADPNAPWNVYTINSDGTGAQQVTTDTAVPARNIEPDWENAPSFFFDDFTEINSDTWNTSIATSGVRWCGSAWGNCGISGPHGSLSIVGSGAEFGSNGRSFPYIWRGPPSRQSPFPSSGDFALETRIKFHDLGNHGPDAIRIQNWPNTDPQGTNTPFIGSIFNVHADTGGLRAVLFGTPHGIANPGLPHTYRVEYVGGTYTLYVDGVKRGEHASEARPNVIMLGYPLATALASNWSDFNVAWVQVLSGGSAAPAEPHPQQVVVTASSDAKTADVLLACPEAEGLVHHVVDVGVTPTTDEGGNKVFEIPTQSGCPGGQFKVAVSDNFSRTAFVDAGAPTENTDPRPPTVAITSPETNPDDPYLSSRAVFASGSARSERDVELSGDGLQWKVKQGGAIVATGTGSFATFLLAPGDYTIELTATDAATGLSSTAEPRPFTVKLDGDKDGIEHSLDNQPCVKGTAANGDANPLNSFADGDGDGVSNGNDVYAEGADQGICTPRTSADGTATFPKEMSLGSASTSVNAGIYVPFARLADVTRANVRITKIAGAATPGTDASYTARSWLPSNDTAVANFNQAAITTFAKAQGVKAGNSFDIEVTGQGTTAGKTWTFVAVGSTKANP
jgi:Tol biopolymer transport system component